MIAPWHLKRRCIFGLVLLLPLAARAQPERIDPNRRTVVLPRKDALIDTVQSQLTRGNWTAARLQFDETLKTAASKEEEAELTIAFAGAVERTARSTGRKEWLAESEELYQAVMSTAKGEVRLQAANNYCTQLLRSKRVKDAVDVMAEATELIKQDPSLSRVAKSRSLYNYGRALELSGQIAQASAVQWEAMEADPGYGRAARAAASLALKAPGESTGIPELTQAVEYQLSAGRYSDAASSLKAGLRMPKWMGHRLYPRMVGLLVRYFAAARVDPNTYSAEWQEFLRGIADRNDLWSTCKPMLEQIGVTYAGRLPIAFYPMHNNPLGDRWRRAVELHHLSQFLTVVGDHFYRIDNHRGALGCYSQAWSLDNANMQAGLYAANILLLDQKRDRLLDPNGVLIERLIEVLFQLKAIDYMEQDWDRILKFHIILGTIFEQQGRWGPAGEPASAYFQWNHAQIVLRKADPEAQERFSSLIRERLDEARKHLP